MVSNEWLVVGFSAWNFSNSVASFLSDIAQCTCRICVFFFDKIQVIKYSSNLHMTSTDLDKSSSIEDDWSNPQIKPSGTTDRTTSFQHDLSSTDDKLSHT